MSERQRRLSSLPVCRWFYCLHFKSSPTQLPAAWLRERCRLHIEDDTAHFTTFMIKHPNLPSKWRGSTKVLQYILPVYLFFSVSLYSTVRTKAKDHWSYTISVSHDYKIVHWSCPERLRCFKRLFLESTSETVLSSLAESNYYFFLCLTFWWSFAHAFSPALLDIIYNFNGGLLELIVQLKGFATEDTLVVSFLRCMFMQRVCSKQRI